MSRFPPNREPNHRFIFSSIKASPPLVFHYSQPLTTDPLPRTPRLAPPPISPSQPFEPRKGVLTLEYCNSLLSDLIKNPSLAPFRVKVTPEDAPDYQKIISHPMDLTTLRHRLLFGQITSVAQFKRELDLIWDNCIAYNKPGHTLSVIASEARKTIDTAWNESEQPGKSHALEKLKDLSQLLDEMKDAASRVFRIEPRPVISPMKIPKFVPHAPVVKPPPPKADEVVPNRKQQKEIAERLSHSPISEMKRAWDLVLPYVEKGSAEFSLSNLPDQVLIELKGIVLS
jgi:hypothetical protein